MIVGQIDLYKIPISVKVEFWIIAFFLSRDSKATFSVSTLYHRESVQSEFDTFIE